MPLLFVRDNIVHMKTEAVVNAPIAVGVPEVVSAAPFLTGRDMTKWKNPVGKQEAVKSSMP